MLLFGPESFAQEKTEAREFMMSATYGVLAGTLVGAALLAFEDRPGDNLKKVAQGASWGLYAGIALGIYVVYGVPGGGEVEDSGEEELLEDDEDEVSLAIPSVLVSNSGRVEGLAMNWLMTY